jgi:predicted HTH transcriptional regulator
LFDTSGALTIAGLLALGDAPQQWFANFVIQASLAPTANDSPDIRIADRARFSEEISHTRLKIGKPHDKPVAITTEETRGDRLPR